MSFAPRSRKRRLQIDPVDSSDPPMFSSDDLLCSSTEDYQNGRRKRQYKGTWWGEEERLPVDDDPVTRPKREFKRGIDSGVWMGSDGSLMEETDGIGNTQQEESACVKAAFDSMDGGAALDDDDEEYTQEFQGPSHDKKAVLTPEVFAGAIVQRCLDEGVEDIDLRFVHLAPSAI
jgi:hypothetical protein